MDPLTVTATVSALIISIVKTGKSLSLLFELYSSAHRRLFLIQTECTVLAAALAQIQSHFGSSDRDNDGIVRGAKAEGTNASGRGRELPPSLVEALDLSLMGCTMTMEILTNEVSAMIGEGQLNSTLNSSKKMGLVKAKYVWKEESMNASLQQLRGQSMALGLLLKAVDNASIDRILEILESGKPVFQAVERNSASIRETYGAKRYPHSIANMTMMKIESLYDIITEKDVVSIDRQDDVTWSGTSDEMMLGEASSTAQHTRFPSVETTKLSQKTHIQGQDRLSSTLRDGLAKLGMRPKSPLPRKPVRAPVAPYVRQPASQPASQSIRQPISQPVSPSVSQTISQSVANVANPIWATSKAGLLMPWEIGTPQNLKGEIESIHQRSQVPGLAVGVLNYDRTDVVVAGVRKHGNSTPIAHTDIFNISGLTEPMTATVIARFVEWGDIKWTDTIDEILPEFAEMIHQGHKNTTLEMFAAHLSGLVESVYSIEQGQLWSYLWAGRVDGSEGRRAVVMCYLRRPPDVNPGAYTWSYANYAIVGFILEYMTGKSWENIMKTELFDPLEMYHTGFRHADPIRNSRSSNPIQPFPHSYSDRGSNRSISNLDPSNAKYFEPPGLDSAGAIHSSVPDMCIYLRLHLDALMGKYKTTFLRKESFEMLYETVGGGEMTRSGMNQAHRTWASGNTWSRRGHSFGFAAGMWIAPEAGRAIISMVNLQGEYGCQIEDECSSTCTRFHP